MMKKSIKNVIKNLMSHYDPVIPLPDKCSP
jgi:hypothetical protein